MIDRRHPRFDARVAATIAPFWRANRLLPRRATAKVLKKLAPVGDEKESCYAPTDRELEFESTTARVFGRRQTNFRPMPPAPRQASPSARKAKGDGTKRDEAEDGAAESARKGSKKAAPKRSSVVAKGRKGAGDENESLQDAAPQRELDRVRVFLKIASDTGSSVSSCVTCDQKNNSAWALDFDGQRNGAVVTLDGVYGPDAQEQTVYPDVVTSLVTEFMSSSRGVGCLLVYGQSEAGKEALMYGEAGSRINMTPRSLPAPGHAPQTRAPGLVLAAFRTALQQITDQKDEAGGQVEMQMGCVMLHMELLRDLLSPQVRPRRPHVSRPTCGWHALLVGAHSQCSPPPRTSAPPSLPLSTPRPPHNLAHNHLQPATSNLPSLTRPAACLLVPPSRAASSSPSRPPMACSSRASTGSRLPTSRRRRASSNSPPKTRPCTRCRPTTASSTRATSSPRSASRRTRPPGRASPPTSYSTLSSWPPPRCPARVACPALTSRTFVPSTRRCAGSSPRSARWRARATRARRCATRSSPASSRAPSGKTSSAPTFSCA